jgi:hypothetical protein
VLSLDQVVEDIRGYEDIVEGIKDNCVDILLRKVKGFTIGIDKNSF